LIIKKVLIFQEFRHFEGIVSQKFDIFRRFSNFSKIQAEPRNFPLTKSLFFKNSIKTRTFSTKCIFSPTKWKLIQQNTIWSIKMTFLVRPKYRTLNYSAILNFQEKKNPQEFIFTQSKRNIINTRIVLEVSEN
jgi:hypothetical protein